MPQDVKIWAIRDKKDLTQIQKSRLDYEDRIEDWIEEDVSIVSNDYLIIGRQVLTSFNKKIDLLCIDFDGNIVIIELKRDKTPRDIVAQTLDYASWVKDLSSNDIIEIARNYFGANKSLDNAFKEKFGENLPEILNSDHSMLIVASEIDASTERIIQYLSETYNVGINIIQFQYHKDENEYLSRVFLIDPEIAQENIRRLPKSKKKPNLTVEQLEEIAYNNGVSEIYKILDEGFSNLFDGWTTTLSSLGFYGKEIMGAHKCKLFNLIPVSSNKEDGLKFQAYTFSIAEFFGVDENKISVLLPKNKTEWHYHGGMDPEWSGYEGFFKDKNDAELFIQELRKLIET